MGPGLWPKNKQCEAVAVKLECKHWLWIEKGILLSRSQNASLSNKMEKIFIVDLCAEK